MLEAINEILPGINGHFDRVLPWILQGYLYGVNLWRVLPDAVRHIVELAFFLAVLCIVTSLLKSILHNYKEWRPMPNSRLMFSYFCGSGDYQRKLIYENAKKLVCDKTWPWISAAGLAFRLGNISHSSKVIMFLLSFAYLFLAVVGIAEMIFRFIIGYIAYFLINIFLKTMYLAVRLFIYILIPFFRISDRAARMEQHCPHCYNTFKLPCFKCPHCGEIHSLLIPAKSGIFFARCSCGHFLPCSVLSKRSKLSSVCPKCYTDLAASNAKQFSIQVIGGNSAGKTAFIAAFQHLYQSHIDTSVCVVRCEPKNVFNDIEEMYMNGCTEPSCPSEVIPYTLVHQTGGALEQSLVFYDIPDEIILSEEYERSPLNFGYSDGIVVIIDPLSVSAIRNECEKLDPDSIRGASQDSADSIVIHFITKFSEITGRAARKMSNVPVAVLIAKCDVRGVKNKIGLSKIKSIFNGNPEKYQNNMEIAVDEVCRQYLSDIGLSNILNNLDAVFSTVHCFPISSIGHISMQGLPFEPYGVVEPITWIADKGHSGISEQLKAVQSCVSAEGFHEQMSEQSRAARYAEAERIYKTGKFETAEKIFLALGNYKDAAEKVKRMKEFRYNAAEKKLNEKDFDVAIKEFRALGGYKDAMQRMISVQYAKADWMVSEARYKDAIDFLSTLQASDALLEKTREVRYIYALYLIQNQDYIAAEDEFKQLGKYRDSQHKFAGLYIKRLRQQIRDGARRKIQFGKYDWRVLTLNNDYAMMITENYVKNAAFHETLADTCWSDSGIRKYLNTEFLNEFNDVEKIMILAATIRTSDNPEYGTPGGSNTSDRVFLLSISEARQYFSNDDDRGIDASSPGVEAEWCWLRSMGGTKTYAAIIEKSGKISTGGSQVTNSRGGIRPVIFFKL